VRAAWKGPQGPKLRLLPERISLETIRQQAGPDDRRVLLGINESNLEPVGVNVAEDSHLYLFGDTDSGKSSMLRAYASEIARLYTPAQAKLFVVDYRRALLGELPQDHVAEYMTTEEQVTAEMEGLTAFLRTRLPGPDVTPEQLRGRSWWSGSEAFILVDDYDLVVTSSGSPLRPLVPLLAQAADVGLHLVVTRRAGGASRASYEPVLQALRDLASPGIMLSTPPDEGALVGTVKGSLQPAGRGRLVTRDEGNQFVQLAWLPARHG
jgi:S-DNA-T family DNA segregation ATPase FtsK/SpoIIIE